jgi:hypothetical protein
VKGPVIGTFRQEKSFSPAASGASAIVRPFFKGIEDIRLKIEDFRLILSEHRCVNWDE